MTEAHNAVPQPPKFLTSLGGQFWGSDSDVILQLFVRKIILAQQVKLMCCQEITEPCATASRNTCRVAASSISSNLGEGLLRRLWRARPQAGAWRLVSYIESPVDGSPKRSPLGEEPQGIIMYTPDGYMSAQLMRPGRRKFAPEEFVEEAAGYIAYSGPFYVDEEKQTLVHSVDVSLFPGWLGQTQARLGRIEGDLLHLTTATPINSGGAKVMASLTWKRAERHD